MNHAEVRSRMADYLEGDLELSARALFDGHLDGCESCGREFAQLRETIHLLRSLPDPEPPPLLAENVMRRIRSGEGAVRFGDRIRAGLALLARPRVLIPATALVIGLMLAPGSFEHWQLPVGGFGQASDRPRVALQVNPERLVSPERTGAAGLDPRLARDVAFVPESSPVVADGLQALRRRDASSSQAWTIHASKPAPAVARAPRISIQIPVGAPGSREGAPRVVTRWPSGTAPPASRPFPSARAPRTGSVDNRVMPASGADVAALQASAFRPLDSGVGERERRKRAELDGRLGELMRHPAAFSREFASLTTIEQEIWLQALAEYALEQNRGAEALQRLRLVADPITLEVATAFSAELRRLRTEERPAVVSAVESR